MYDLSILVVTRFETHSTPFLALMIGVARRLGAQLVVALDGAHPDFHPDHHIKAIHVNSQGYLESVLHDCVQQCDGKYVLRLDDDERCSPAMEKWLASKAYDYEPNHWKFPRAHLWKTTDQVLLTPQLWPDHQTRLSLKGMSGGRRQIHSGSPYGGGREAPCVIEHHKFLVKTPDERWEIARRYDRIVEGSGTGGMMAFSVPEHAYCDPKSVWWLAPLGDGDALAISNASVRHEGSLT